MTDEQPVEPTRHGVPRVLEVLGVVPRLGLATLNVEVVEIDGRRRVRLAVCGVAPDGHRFVQSGVSLRVSEVRPVLLALSTVDRALRLGTEPATGGKP